MRKFMVLASVVAVVLAFGTYSAPAKADSFGIHVSGPGYHVDLGRAHHRHAYYGGHRSLGYGFYGNSCYGGGRTWHDTSHWDYHPGEFVRHRNHYHYVPGHLDYHHTGHWDHW